MYEICVFTAGEQVYADTVLDIINKERTIIKHRLYRQHCVNCVPGIYVKDLRIINDRKLSELVIVDNSIVSFAYNLENGIPISAFTGDGKDEEMLFLVTYLEELYSVNDVRPYLQNAFRLPKILQETLEGNKNKVKPKAKSSLK